jgi:hypothetical protein
MAQRFGFDVVLFQEVMEILFKVLVQQQDMVALRGEQVLGSQVIVQHKRIFFHLFFPYSDHMIEKAGVVR